MSSQTKIKSHKSTVSVNKRGWETTRIWTQVLGHTTIFQNSVVMIRISWQEACKGYDIGAKIIIIFNLSSTNHKSSFGGT